MFFGGYFGKYFGYIGDYVTNEVDVRVIKGAYIPCRTCHWFNVCTVPKGRFLPKLKEYQADSDIHFHRNYSRGANTVVYHCLEYSVRNKRTERGY